MFCICCGERLTPHEVRYYRYRCEPCEDAWSMRMTMWMRGVNDNDLDRMEAAHKAGRGH